MFPVLVSTYLLEPPISVIYAILVLSNGLEHSSQSSDLGTVRSEALVLTAPTPTAKCVAGYQSTGTGQPPAAGELVISSFALLL